MQSVNQISKVLYQAIFVWVSSWLVACGQADSLSEPEQLAQTHCSSCHAFPEPDLLDRATWQGSVLPQMALRMGIAPANINESKIQQAYYHLTETGLYPRPALISTEDWEKIVQFYDSLAPESLPVISDSLPITKQFAFHQPEKKLPPAATCVYFHQETQQMLVADHTQGQLLTIGSEWEAQPLLSQTKLISHIQSFSSNQPDQSSLLITYLGENIRPEDRPSGEVAEVVLASDTVLSYQKLDLPDLPRVTQALYVNLVGDTNPELLTCSFGYLNGRLSFWQQDESGSYQESVIRNEAGAQWAIPQDVDQDGKMDIFVLWGQGDERIALYQNLGDGSFEEKILLRFPPSYGSSYFELADFDGDGLLDILYTCGDNADYSTVLKPYHGVYIFQNQGDQQYEQTYFFPMNGAYRAIARDFDGDNDLDIAAVSFFADYAHRPEEGFVYLENQNQFQFQASTLPIHKLGRWITLDAGDVDQDGDLDLVLGNCSTAGGFDRTLDRQWKEGPPYVILENRQNPS
ncbi:FG-GAP repeat domain-containing protein [Tunicatimonas pelagia]|uniref:FG-GAP repeat domain-containing protein n=1 Tax=Tunicatimonas pelagia TaxID=931531 RepID=UPI002666415B|nr:VCBS repeat-containing protein [Tunicatimonas pelagia]WKN41442.1 VCBS repeat-containing protein [Tunicatimonas pelagia]